MAHVTPIATGGTAVLLQDRSLFARTRREARPEAVARRLEHDTPVAFVRFNRPAAQGDSLRVFERALEQPRGTLRLGLDISSVREALAIQRRSAMFIGLLLWVGAVGATIV